MGWIGWLLAYYVPALLLSWILLTGSADMYRKEESSVPYRYMWATMIPFLGFWVTLLFLVGDWARHFQNVEHESYKKSTGKKD